MPASLLCMILALYRGMQTSSKERAELDSGNSITCTRCDGSAPTFAVFCPHCGDLLPPFTPIDPHQKIAAEGQMDWRGTPAPMSPIVVAGMWLVSCLTLLLAVGALANAVRDPTSYLGERVLYAVLGCASATLSIVFGFRVYQNFRRHTWQSRR
jgi:hypothetical protein